MAIKYTVQRIGDPSDRGPAGECGILLVGEQSGKSHGETVLCPTAHTHSKQCAVDALDAQSFVVTPAVPAVEEVKDDQGAVIVAAQPAVPAVTESPRQRIAGWFAAQAAKEAAQAAVVVDPLPKKSVQKVVDGKTKTVMEDDKDLT